MLRCIELAKLGAGDVAPNPMVGSVLVYDNMIIGEGYHQRYGEAHAEVNCINSVKEAYTHLISSSTLYVSLEPCAHYGKTPPCSDLIIKCKIPRVVIGCRDPFEAVNGKGIEKLSAAGVGVVSGVLQKECEELNKRFLVFHLQKRPYIVLKWAQTADEKIGSHSGERLLISNEYSNRLVHQWRSEEMAIMVGTHTVLKDDPSLTTRLWPGNHPVRIVVDLELKLPLSLKVFDENTRTIIFNAKKEEEQGSNIFCLVNKDGDVIQQMLHRLFEMNIQSVLVEGGAKLLQSFIDEGAWDEIRKIENVEWSMGPGVSAPIMKNEKRVFNEQLLSDTIGYYLNTLLNKGKA